MSYRTSPSFARGGAEHALDPAVRLAVRDMITAAAPVIVDLAARRAVERMTRRSGVA
jgi:hypothetical protein